MTMVPFAVCHRHKHQNIAKRDRCDNNKVDSVHSMQAQGSGVTVPHIFSLSASLFQRAWNLHPRKEGLVAIWY